MWLVLSENDDFGAQWLAESLQQRAGIAVKHCTREQLEGAFWHRRCGEQSERRRLLLEDGREVDSDRVVGVINRLLPERNADWPHAPAARRRHALLCSWLQSLGDTWINRAGPLDAARPQHDWFDHAVELGLPCRRAADVRADELHQIVLVGDRVLGMRGCDVTLIDGCQRLADRLDAELLGFWVALAPHPVLIGVDRQTDLRRLRPNLADDALDGVIDLLAGAAQAVLC